MPTDFDALDALYPLAPEELPRQWVLTRDPDQIPEGWERRSRDGWTLGAHPEAHVCALTTVDGATVGWAVEPLAVLGRGGDVAATGRIALPVPSGSPLSHVERALYGRDEDGRCDGDGLAGSWVAALFDGQGSGRVYLGPKHSVVYSPEHRTVATTHNLVPGLRRNVPLSLAVDPLATGAYFTFGRTAFRGLHRLLPNHYLDLDTFVPVRHWPVAPWEPLERGERGASAIVDHARRLLTALSSQYDAYRVFLSAGRDSRAVLAVLRPLVDEGVPVVLSTRVTGDLGSRTDLQAARRLARIAGLPHTVSRGLPGRRSGPEGVLRGFARIGEARAGTFLATPGGPEEDPPARRLNVGGMGGETGRAYFWGEKAPRRVGADTLVERTQSPPVREVVEAAETWLEGLPPWLHTRPEDVLDLAYVEQRLGCWQAPSTYLSPGRRHVSNPMTEAFALETMLRLPVSYRAAGVLQRDMAAYGWPDLLTVPFNQPTGWLRLSRELGRTRFHLGALRQRLLAMG